MVCLSSFVVSATLAATALASVIPKALPWANLAISASPDDRYLCRAKTNEPFFWIADTNWELFHKFNRTDVDLYLADRATKASTSSRRLFCPSTMLQLFPTFTET